MERESEVASILSSQTNRNSVKFAWPLLRDTLAHCQCAISGAAVEIERYLCPLDAFGSILFARFASNIYVGDGLLTTRSS
jgi:hypothetical protein